MNRTDFNIPYTFGYSNFTTHFETSSNTHNFQAHHLVKWIPMLQNQVDATARQQIDIYPNTMGNSFVEWVPHFECNTGKWLKSRVSTTQQARAFTTFLQFSTEIPCQILVSLSCFTAWLDLPHESTLSSYTLRSLLSHPAEQRVKSTFF